MLKAIERKKKNTLGVLVLDGIFKKNCTPANEVLSSYRADTTLFDKIPNKFTTIDLWIKNTNLCCWWCTRTFHTRPWFNPISVDYVTNDIPGVSVVSNLRYSFCTEGVFCSCNCVRAYIDLHSKSFAEHYDRVELLKLLYEVMCGKQPIDIEPSPPPTQMIQFGGWMNTVEYQKRIDKLNKTLAEEATAVDNDRHILNLLNQDF